MMLGFGWGRFFFLLCLGLIGVCLPLGQARGAEQVAEPRLVYVELVGEPLVAFVHPIRLVGVIGDDEQFKTRMCCHGTR